MGKTLLYIFIVAVLGVGVYYFLFTNHDGFAKSEAGFTIKDTADIGKIYIADNFGRSITLERMGDHWMVNKKFKALKGTTRTLLMTLNRQEATAPVPKNAHNAVIKNLSSNGIKVEVYDKKGDKMTTFYVGSETGDFKGTYMLTEGAQKPYVVNIPGFPGYLTTRYSTDIEDWRDRTVFDLQPEQIKQVSVQYPDKPINSFTIQQNGGKITVTGDPLISTGKETNLRRAGVYLKYFSNISSEGHLNGKFGIDTTIRNAHKQSVIDLTGIHGEHQHVDIYWIAANKRSKNLTTPAKDVPEQYDADRFYAVINDAKDTVLIQRFIFGKMFRQGYEFFEKDNAPAPADEHKGKDPTNVIMHKP